MTLEAALNRVRERLLAGSQYAEDSAADWAAFEMIQNYVRANTPGSSFVFVELDGTERRLKWDPGDNSVPNSPPRYVAEAEDYPYAGWPHLEVGDLQDALGAVEEIREWLFRNIPRPKLCALGRKGLLDRIKDILEYPLKGNKEDMEEDPRG